MKYESEYSENNESEEGVEVNAAFLIPVAIFVGSFAIGVVSDYYCELNGGKFYLPNTWNQNNTFNFSCAISAGTTVVGTTALVKGATKIAVTKYSSKVVVEGTAKSLGKSADDLARIGATAYYNDYTGVVKFLKQYNKLPNNYIKYDDALKLGWDPKKGNLYTILPGRSIGGDIYKNATNPKIPISDKPGRIWYEADINYTSGYRLAERLVWSNDGLYFKTNHYKDWIQIK